MAKIDSISQLETTNITPLQMQGAVDHVEDKANPHDVTAAQVGAATTVTLTASIETAWTGSSAPYSQEIAVSGILGTDNPIVDILLSTDMGTAKSEESNWLKVSKITTSAGKITVVCFSDKPTIKMNIQLKVVR